MSDVYAKLQALQITLPPLAAPAAAYVPYVQTGKLLFISGHLSLVNSAPTYTEQHLVTNGCSELLGEVFGAEKGAHARSAFGVAQIPLGACVEIELIAELA